MDKIVGTDANDVLTGTDIAFSDGIVGNGGDDLIYGLNGHNIIYGDYEWPSPSDAPFGNDTIMGGSDLDLVSAGKGDDIVFGNDGFDQMNGNAGNDFISGGGDDDYIHGEEGDDVLVGGTGDPSDSSFMDQLYGGAGDDIEIAGPDGATMGGEYFDTGFGAEFYEDKGNDVMIAGDGHDQVWMRVEYNQGDDVVENFNPDEDTIFVVRQFGSSHDVGDIVSQAIQVGNNTVISFSEDYSLTLTGTDVDDLTANPDAYFSVYTIS